MIMQNYFFFRKPESIVKEMFACVSVYFFCVDFAICFTLFCFCIFYFIILLSAKVFTSLYELGLTLLTRYQPFLLPLFLLLN